MRITKKTLSPLPRKNIGRVSKKLCSSRLHSCTKRIGTKKKNTLAKFLETLKRISVHSSSRSQSNLKLASKKTFHLGDRSNWKNESFDGVIGSKDRKRRLRRKKKRKSIVQDEASCLQRRARYLLIKMKSQLNLIDAYSGDGWKGQRYACFHPRR